MAKKRGMLETPTSISIEEVTGRHRATCATCEEVPVGKRVIIRKGAGRYAKNFVYCMKHAMKPLKEVAKELRKMRDQVKEFPND